MKICFLWGSMGIGGAERVISSLSNTFVQNDDEVCILVSDSNPSKYILDKKVKYITLGMSGENTTLVQTAKSAIKKISLIKAKMRQLDPDIIIAFHVKLAILAKVACPNRVVIGSERSNPYKTRISNREKLIVQLSSFLNGFVFQTKGARNFYPRTVQKKSAVIPNAISISVPADLQKYQERSKQIVFVGRLKKEKRVDLLLKAFEAISSKHSEYHLLIYGEGREKEYLVELAKKKALANKVFFMGFTDDVATVLSKSRIFVLSSDEEGMPNTLIEAMACGCACVSTDCNFGPSELINNGVNGMLVETGNDVQIANALDKILSDERFGEYLSNNAKLISKELSMDAVAQKYKTYFTSLIKD